MYLRTAKSVNFKIGYLRTHLPSSDILNSTLIHLEIKFSVFNGFKVTDF